MTIYHAKQNIRPLSIIPLITLYIIIVLTLPGCSRHDVEKDVANHIVVILDASDSYKARQTKAVEKVVNILDEMSKIKLKRWESQSDKIFIISLDASPDTIWQGSLKELKAQSPSFWKERFMARTDYAACTDVSGAFRLAAKYLEGDSRYVSKYLFVFSDLLHEPPTNDMRSCQYPAKVPPEDFPWSSLKDVSVSVFWMPLGQKLLWRKAVQEHGMEANFNLYTTAESATVSIPNPSRPEEKVTEGERHAQKEQIKSEIKSGLGVIALIVAAFILLIIVGFLLARYRSRQSKPALRNPVRPMPFSQRPRPAAPPVSSAGRPGNNPRPPVIPQRRRPQ